MPDPFSFSIISLSVAAVVVTGYVCKTFEAVSKRPEELARETGKAMESLVKTICTELSDVLGAKPRVTVDRVVIQEAPSSIRELSLAKEVFRLDAGLSHSNWGSKKTIRISQSFAIRAGFDLNRLKLSIDETKKEAVVTISEAVIISVEGLPDLKIDEDAGWWNSITKEDREAVLNSLPGKAKEKALEHKLDSRAEHELKLIIGRLLAKQHVSLRVVRQDDAVVFASGRPLIELAENNLAKLGIERAEEKLPIG